MWSLKKALVAGALAAMVTNAVAQPTYPAKPMTWIVPFAVGGPTDVFARSIADRVARELGQPIVIENVAGAGGTIGATRGARATPDGYTFLVGHMGYMGAAPALYKKLGYDPVKDFEPVFRFPDTPLVLLVRAGSPYKTPKELIDFARKNPGKLNFGNAGVGSTSHLVAALFATNAGVSITPISYKGAGPALNDLIGGQLDAMFDQTNTALPQVQGGRVTAIGVTSDQPIAQFPGVPTIAQSALPGFEAATWYGLYAPKSTSKDIVQKVYEAYGRVMGDPGFTKKLADQGIRLLPGSQYAPEAFARHTASEVERWRKVAATAKIELD